jgi:type IV secretory pathway TraG/TraD family ATPase VirD4
MRSETNAERGAVNPLAPLNEMLHWSIHAALAALLGMALGVICARAMRRARLHWSWAVVALTIVIATDPVSTVAGCSLSVTALTAAACGRRWHREDVAAGLDLARLAGSLRGPLDVPRALLEVARAKVRALAARAWWARQAREGELALGLDERGRPATIPFGGRGGGTHVLITGATGSGKTVTQATIAARAIARGMGAVVIDPKGDARMRDALHRASLECGRRFFEWTPDGPSVYNPYSRGSDTEIADKVLASERFTEPHYQRQAQRYLGHVVRALREADVQTSLSAIVQHLDPPALEVLTRTLGDPEHPTHQYLDALTARQQSDLAGVRDRLAILAESDVGRWLEPAGERAEEFDLLAAVRERAVVYFALEADSRPLLAQMLGGAIVQDLQTVVASLQGDPVATVAVIDEFASLGSEHVVRLFARARSAGISLLLGAQELADVRAAGRERLLEQVLGNLSALIAHRQVVPDSAALIARMSGSRGAWRTSLHGDGRSTRTRVSEPALSAEQLSRLQAGSAAVLDLRRDGHSRIVRVQAS